METTPVPTPDLAADRELVKQWVNRIPVHATISNEEQLDYKEKISRLLQEKNAALVAHYYTDAAIQALAEETGGYVSDSLEMARFGTTTSATTLVVAGVRFM